MSEVSILTILKASRLSRAKLGRVLIVDLTVLIIKISTMKTMIKTES